MRKVITILLLLFSVWQTGYSQERLTALSADTITYQQLLNQDWDALIETGNRALAAGIDFYYLRYRLGIAWYEKKNYHKAAVHFDKAFRMSSEDDLLREYLYFSYVFAGRGYESSYLDYYFATRFKNKLTQLEDCSL